MSSNFTHLHLHSQYSLLDGAITFDELIKQAKEFGMEITGSEIIGLVPKNALIEAGAFYAGNNSEEELVKAAIENLGLSQLNKFELAKKIIENLL